MLLPYRQLHRYDNYTMAERIHQTHRLLLLSVTAISETDRVCIKKLNNAFTRQELFIDIQQDRIEIFIRVIDFSKLQSLVNRLTKDYRSRLPAQIIEAIGAVRTYGIKAGKRRYVSYAGERRVRDRSAKELRRGKHYYANDHNYKTTNNQPPSSMVNQIIVGDAQQVLQRLPDNCVDLIFTSPPYNFGLDYGTDADDQCWDDYFAKLFAIFSECIRVVKWGGRIAVNIQPLFSDYIPSHHLISSFFIERRLIWKGELLWEKNNYNCKYTAWGSWKSPSSPYLKYTWEFIEVFAKGSLKHRGNSADADITADEFKSWVNAKWSIAPERNMKRYQHPAIFPEELARRVLKLFSFSGSLVLDPFVGVGTTAVVAKQLNRRYLGIDISPSYCQTAIERLSN